MERPVATETWSAELSLSTHLTPVLDAFEDPAALIGADGTIVATNRAWHVHGFDRAAFADGDPIPVAAAAAGEIEHRAGVGRRGSRDGWRWYRSRVRTLRNVEGVAAVLTHRDITDERRLQLRMARSPVAHLELDPTGRLLGVNERWEELRGRPVGAELGDRWLRDTPSAQREELTGHLAEGEAFSLDLSTVGPDDRRLTLCVEFEPLLDGNELIGWHASATDRTDLVALESAAENVLVDTVTGLANRALFETTLSRKLSGRRGTSLAVLFVDLDGFKSVNDTYGHLAGDNALKIIAARLAGVLRPDDLIARYGGDEFAVMLDGVGPDFIREVGERLAEAGGPPISLGGTEVQVGVSVGVAVSRPGDDVDSIVARADHAMYRAKEAGGSRVELAEPA
jgi:diguanylate cyclase (GGDEF)-like protein